MAKKNKHPANPENENPGLQSAPSVELIHDIKKLELQHLVLNKMLNSKKKASKPNFPGFEIQQKHQDQ